jgi:hypothetical protein
MILTEGQQAPWGAAIALAPFRRATPPRRCQRVSRGKRKQSTSRSAARIRRWHAATVQGGKRSGANPTARRHAMH